MTYKEAEKELATLQAENETVFRTAIYHLFSVGTRSLTDEAVRETCDEISKQDDSRSLVSNEYQCAIVRTAAKLGKHDLAHLLKYISRNVKLNAG